MELAKPFTSTTPITTASNSTGTAPKTNGREQPMENWRCTRGLLISIASSGNGRRGRSEPCLQAENQTPEGLTDLIAHGPVIGGHALWIGSSAAPNPHNGRARAALRP